MVGRNAKNSFLLRVQSIFAEQIFVVFFPFSGETKDFVFFRFLQILRCRCPIPTRRLGRNWYGTQTNLTETFIFELKKVFVFLQFGTDSPRNVCPKRKTVSPIASPFLFAAAGGAFTKRIVILRGKEVTVFRDLYTKIIGEPAENRHFFGRKVSFSPRFGHLTV